jgi:hypothetical protein
MPFFKPNLGHPPNRNAWIVEKKKDQSFRLRLHSGVSTPANKLAGDPGFGRAVASCGRSYFGTAEAVPFRMWMSGRLLAGWNGYTPALCGETAKDGAPEVLWPFKG